MHLSVSTFNDCTRLSPVYTDGFHFRSVPFQSFSFCFVFFNFIVVIINHCLCLYCIQSGFSSQLEHTNNETKEVLMSPRCLIKLKPNTFSLSLSLLLVVGYHVSQFPNYIHIHVYPLAQQKVVLVLFSCFH